MKKPISFILILVMLLTMTPLNVFATSTDSIKEYTVSSGIDVTISCIDFSTDLSITGTETSKILTSTSWIDISTWAPEIEGYTFAYAKVHNEGQEKYPEYLKIKGKDARYSKKGSGEGQALTGTLELYYKKDGITIDLNCYIEGTDTVIGTKSITLAKDESYKLSDLANDAEPIITLDSGRKYQYKEYTSDYYYFVSEHLALYNIILDLINDDGDLEYKYDNGCYIDWDYIAEADAENSIKLYYTEMQQNYIASFDSNAEGIISPEAIDADADGYVTLPAISSRAGFEFLGWSIDQDAEEGDIGITASGVSIQLTDNTIFYAVWKEVVPVGIDAQFYIRTDGVIQQEPARYGTTPYFPGKFMGLPGLLNEAKTVSNDLDGVKANIALEPTGAEIEVAAASDGNINTNFDADTQYVKWYVIKYVQHMQKDDGDGNWYYHVDGVICDKDSITLSYDINYPNSEEPTTSAGIILSQPWEPGTKIQDKVPQDTQYDFLGWSADENATTAEYTRGDSINICADTTLYGVWKEKVAAQYTVNYAENGAGVTGMPSAATGIAAGIYILDTVATPIRAKDSDYTYTFLGWGTSGGATTTVASITVPATTTVYAVWKPVQIPNMSGDVTAEGYTGYYDGTAHGITVTVPTGAAVSYNVANALTNAGIQTVEYTVTKTGYKTVTGSAVITISPAAVTVSAINAEKYFGETDPALRYTSSGAVGNQVPGFTGTLTRAAGEAAGPYAITQGGLVLAAGTNGFLASNYTMNFVPGTFTIKEQDMSGNVSVTGYTGIYDATAHGITVKTPTGAAVSYNVANALTDAGIQTVEYTVTKAGYKTVTGSAVITISPAALTVSAINAEKYFGTTDPALQYTSSGAVGNQVPGFTGTLTRAAGEAAGPYAITQGGLVLAAGTNGFLASNYTMNFVPGTFTIKEQDMSGNVSVTGYTGIYDGTAHGITVKTPTGAAVSYNVANALTDAGIQTVEYTVTKTGYKTVTGSAVITISPAAVTVSAINAEKYFGETDPALQYTSSGAVGNQVPGFTGTLTRAAGEAAGPYAITQGGLVLAAGTNGFLASNYTMNFVPGTFTIKEQDMSGNVSVTGYTGIYDGRAHGITVTTPTGAGISYNISNALTDAGIQTVEYTVTKTGYKTVTGSAVITISPAAVTVSAINAEKYFGETDPALQYTSSGAVGNQVPGFTGTLTRAAGEAAGPYAITQGGLVLAVGTNGFLASNYTMNFVPGTFTIKEQDMSGNVSVTGYTGIYDATAHGITVKTPTGAAVSYNVANALTNAGIQTVEYTVTKAGYKTVTGSAVITISPAAVTVSAINAEKYFGETDPALQYTSSGAVGNQVPGFTGTLTRAAGEAAGPYAITQGGLVLAVGTNGFLASNYTMNFVPGTFTIKEQDMSGNVSVTGYTGIYDATAHGITVKTPTGAAVSYNVANALTNAGIQTVEYTVTKTGYKTVTGSAVITISPAALTITADSASKVYDGKALTDSGWQDTTPSGIVAGDIILYVDVTGSAINVGTKNNVASKAIIARPPEHFWETPKAVKLNANSIAQIDKEQQLEGIRDWVQDIVADYRAEKPAVSLEKYVMTRMEMWVDVTSNYAIDYKPGTLTITSAGSNHHHHDNNTTIIDEAVPLGGTLELNKTDHFNYVKGYEDGNVKAQNNITREEVATIFYRLLTDASRAMYFSQDEDFSDIASGRWSLNSIATLANGKILTGYENGTFGSTRPITRAEFAAIASRFDSLEETTDNQFSDVSNHWAKSYINSAAKKGWINGYEDGTFKPDQYITRAEAMTLINRVLERRVDADGLMNGYKVFPDNRKSDWYFYQVIEATNNHKYTDRKNMSDMEKWTEILSDKTWNE